jgi:hypothetical protein
MPVPPNWTQNLTQCVHDIIAGTLVIVPNWEEPFMTAFVYTERASSWDEFLLWSRELGSTWGFRGQREASWLPDTSLDRAAKVPAEGSVGTYQHRGYGHLPRDAEEQELLFKFRQQAHLYLTNLPAIDDLGSWLAIMQHSKVPTRLLDFTRSPFVGMYFAVEEEPREVDEDPTNDEDGRSAVWAIDLDWLETQASQGLSSDSWTAPHDAQSSAEYINRVLRQTTNAVILRINPARIDERMVAQQGFFLCKLFDEAHFSLLLMTMMIHSSPPIDRPVVRRLIIEKGLRLEFLKNLREMNIGSASLFPGRDGFGRSLALDLEIKAKGMGHRPLAQT